MKTARSVVFEMETLLIVDDNMKSKRYNFSQTVNYLIKNSDYLLRKVSEFREQAKEIKENQEEELKSKEK